MAYDENLCAKCGGDIRTTNSHNHQFAEITNLFHNLPEWQRSAPYAKSASAFRKHGLIVAGYCEVEVVDMPSQDAACAAAPTISRLAKDLHGYAITVVRGSQIVCTTPHSQSMKAMGGQKFNESKQAVLNWAMQLLDCAEAA